MPRRNNHLDGNYFRGKGHIYFAAEEALGIGLFILVLAILLAFGCWYYKRRSGYKSLRAVFTLTYVTDTTTQYETQPVLKNLQARKRGKRNQSKETRNQLPMFAQHSKSSSVSTIRNVVGEGEILECKMALQDYRDFNSVVPDAPPAYEKIAADLSPPPYSP